MQHYQLAKKGKINRIITDIASSEEAINAELYEAYSSNLRKAINGVFEEDNSQGLSDQLRANVSRFAAYKAYHATNKVRKRVRKEGDMQEGEVVLRTFNRYQAAEYNTAVARARTAKQWQTFDQPDNRELFPCLRWLPSNSAVPREAHRIFWNRVWAKDDPFWNSNQPGNLWNCKCDVEETSDPATSDNPTNNTAKQGLKGNPYTTGQIFSDDASYVAKGGVEVEKKARKIVWKSHFKWAKENLSIAKHADLTEKIMFSTRGIKEYLNQNLDNYYAKNEGIRRLPAILEASEYVGISTYKGKLSHIFIANVFGKEHYLIVNEQNGEFYFYGISESKKILIDINKK